MREILKKLAPSLRRVGFRGSGQNFHKVEGDFIFVVNFQGDRWGGNFYVNLGAQPLFIPAEGDVNADPKTLKEYECILRQRVGKEWSWEMSDNQIKRLDTELLTTQSAFFAHAQTLREALRTSSAETLIREFSAGTTKARAALHLARGSLALGFHDKAATLAHFGLELAGDHADILQEELHRVLKDAAATLRQDAAENGSSHGS
jgi:hypothetical protein